MAEPQPDPAAEQVSQNAPQPNPSGQNRSLESRDGGSDAGNWPYGDTEAEERDKSIMAAFSYIFFAFIFIIAFCILINCLISLYKKKAREHEERCGRRRRIECLPKDYACIKFDPTVRSPCCEPRTEFCLPLPERPLFVPPPCNPCTICK